MLVFPFSVSNPASPASPCPTIPQFCGNQFSTPPWHLFSRIPLILFSILLIPSLFSYIFLHSSTLISYHKIHSCYLVSYVFFLLLTHNYRIFQSATLPYLFPSLLAFNPYFPLLSQFSNLAASYLSLFLSTSFYNSYSKLSNCSPTTLIFLFLLLLSHLLLGTILLFSAFSFFSLLLLNSLYSLSSIHYNFSLFRLCSSLFSFFYLVTLFYPSILPVL